MRGYPAPRNCKKATCNKCNIEFTVSSTKDLTKPYRCYRCESGVRRLTSGQVDGHYIQL